MEFVGDRECPVAADDDERIEAELAKIIDTAVGVVRGPRLSRDRIGERIPAICSAQDRAAQARDISAAAIAEAGRKPGTADERNLNTMIGILTLPRLG